MPLRDHFRPPLSDRRSWGGFHGQWPAMIVMDLSRRLPRRFLAEPRVHLGSSIEIDVATFEGEGPDLSSSLGGGDGGGSGVTTAAWTPPEPTLAIATDWPDPDEYEVRVYDASRGRRLVAAIELVSPANEDRPEHRRAFVARYTALLQGRVSVAICRRRDDPSHQSLRRPDRVPRPGRPVPRERPLTPLRRRLSVGEARGCPLPGDLGAPPGPRPAAADLAPLARRGPRDPPRTRSDPRGDVPRPPHPLRAPTCGPPPGLCGSGGNRGGSGWKRGGRAL